MDANKIGCFEDSAGDLANNQFGCRQRDGEVKFTSVCEASLPHRTNLLPSTDDVLTKST